MTAPTNPAPLPVVACEIVPAFEFHGFDTPPKGATVQADSGTWIAAVAVPLALFEDEAFMTAVWERAVSRAASQGRYPTPDMTTRLCGRDWVDGVLAELRERAGVTA
jgi:hypothetical protein